MITLAKKLLRVVKGTMEEVLTTKSKIFLHTGEDGKPVAILKLWEVVDEGTVDERISQTYNLTISKEEAGRLGQTLVEFSNRVEAPVEAKEDNAPAKDEAKSDKARKAA